MGLQGISSAILTSQGDVQLAGTINTDTNPNRTGPLLGSLTSSGNLTVNAARVYPDTYTDFTLQSPAGLGTTVSIGQTTASPGEPLSAAGTLNVTADNIAISGTMLAPFGQISLTAGDSLTLAKGSVVSVSGSGLDLPFGQTQFNGENWVYTPDGLPDAISNVPAKQVTLTAPAINLQSGATVNVSGGGDLYAYEFVPGTGGSADALAAGAVPGLYAILPAARGQAAPYDPEESASPTQTQTVYLSGGAGLAAGYYALLPARYGLEPGAALIQVEPSYVSASGGQIGALADGTPVIGGYLGFGTTGLHSGVTEYEGFAVYPGSYGQQLAAYTISSAASFFGNQAASAGTGPVSEPADAGTLSLRVSSATNPTLSNLLDLQGSVVTAAASGGRGALVNISAPDLVINDGAAAAASDAGIVVVSAPVIQAWNASQLTLGGETSTQTVTPTTSAGVGLAPVTVTSIAVAANTVTIDSGVSLTADQIDVVAQQSIDVKSGATLASTSGAKGSPLNTLPQQQLIALADVTGSPDSLPQGALLSVSDVTVGVIGQPAANGLPMAGRPASTGGAAATITVESGATLKSGGAVSLDAPGGIVTAGTISGKGASWSLSSDSISFGGSNDTLNIDSALLAELQQAGAVRLASAGDIDIDAPVTLGANKVTATPTLSALTLIASSLNNNVTPTGAGSADSVFGAGTLTLGGVAVAAGDPVVGAGTLSLIADTLVVGPGTLAVDGFANTQAQVAGAVATLGSGGLNVGGTLQINAVQLTAAPDATAKAPGTTIAATGMLTIGAPTQLAAGTSLPTYLGGDLTLLANGIEDAGAIAVPSGLVTLDAGGGTLHLAGTGSIDTAGRIVPVLNQSQGSPGGIVSLVATGNVTLDANSRISVGGAGTAPAGSIDVTGGIIDASSTLQGAASGTGGSFSLNAAQLLKGLTPLAADLLAGGFTDAIEVRVATGPLQLASTAQLTANTIGLTADSGAVDIAGVLSAPSGATRGLIDLSAGNSVTLESSAALHADGAGSAGRGGEIELNSTCQTCTITLGSGSVMSTEGAAEMGEVVLRAPVYSANDMAINVGARGIGADVSRAGQVIIDPVLILNESATTISRNLASDVQAAVNLEAGALPTIESHLNPTGSSQMVVHAGLEIQDSSAADTLVLPSLDLSSFSSHGEVVDLTVRAAGAVTVAGTISDGVTARQTVASSTGAAVYGCATGPCASGTLILVAGADLSSADPLATLSGSQAKLTLGLPAVGNTLHPGTVRTGTGDINLAAAGDIVFTAGSAAYTAGTGTVTTTASILGGHTAGLVNFANDGGDVRIAAGGDVVGAPVQGDAGDYTVTGWQLRQGNATTAAQYGINLDAFDWNVGALAGGDVAVAARGQLSNLSAAVADSYSGGNLIGAGGGLTLRAVGDIGSAQIYVADGIGTVSTGGGLTAVRQNLGNSVGSSFALGNAPISVWARQGIQVDAVYNPTYTAQYGTLAQGGNGAFLSYGANSALDLASTAGDVDFELVPTNPVMGVLIGPSILGAKNGQNNYLIMPSSLSLTSYQQDVDLAIAADTAVLYPSGQGQLQLFAGHDIVTTRGGGFTMADSPVAAVPTVATPGVQLPAFGPYRDGFSEFQGDVHQGDTDPALVTAGQDIVDLQLSIPKAAQIVAGRDILGLTFQGQNLSTSDTTLISAGRDVSYQSAGGIRLGGPGSLDLFAGRNIDLGFSGGVETVGNFDNPNLPTVAGADITMLVGCGTQGADYRNFLTQIVAPSSTYAGDLVNYAESLTGNANLSLAQAETAFGTLTAPQQAAFIDPVFFNELLVSGRAANAGTGVGFTQGYAAISALLSQQPHRHGDRPRHLSRQSGPV